MGFLDNVQDKLDEVEDDFQKATGIDLDGSGNKEPSQKNKASTKPKSKIREKVIEPNLSEEEPETPDDPVTKSAERIKNLAEEKDDEPFRKEGPVEKATVGIDQELQGEANEAAADIQSTKQEAAKDREFRETRVDPDIEKPGDTGVNNNSNVLGTDADRIADEASDAIQNAVRNPADAAANTFGEVKGTTTAGLKTFFAPDPLQRFKQKNLVPNSLPNDQRKLVNPRKKEKDLTTIFEETRTQRSQETATNAESVIQNPANTGKLVAGSTGRIVTSGVAEITTDGEYDSNFDLKGGTKKFAKATAKDAGENPLSFISGAALGGAAGKAVGTAARTTNLPDPKKNLVPTTSNSRDTFGSSAGLADRINPKTGMLRKPRPGEQTPNPLKDDVLNFAKGDLGERRMTPDELREQDVVGGENIPDNPQGIPTKERTRTDVLQDRLTETRKGQAQLMQKPKTKRRIDLDDTRERDVTSKDVTDPQDRRQDVGLGDDFRNKRGEVGDRPRDPDSVFNNPQDSGLSTGLGAGLGAGLNQGIEEDLNQNQNIDNPPGQDQVPEEEFEDDFILDDSQSTFGLADSPDIGREEDFLRQDRRKPDKNRRRPRVPDIGFDQDRDVMPKEKPEDDFVGIEETGEFAPSLTAGLFDIQAEEDFEEEEFVGTGFGIRPLSNDKM